VGLAIEHRDVQALSSAACEIVDRMASLPSRKHWLIGVTAHTCCKTRRPVGAGVGGGNRCIQQVRCAGGG
jgi:hypothetical protein